MSGRSKRQPVPSARVIDPLNDGEKQVTSHRTAFTLARKLEEDAARKQQIGSSSQPVSVLTTFTTPGPTPTSKRSSTQASLSSEISAKRESYLINIVQSQVFWTLGARQNVTIEVIDNEDDVQVRNSRTETTEQRSTLSDTSVMEDAGVPVHLLQFYLC